MPSEAWLGCESVLQTSDPEGRRTGSALTCGHVVVRGVGEAQQQLRPLAAQLVRLVLGLQLHLCGTGSEAAMQPPPVRLPSATESHVTAATANAHGAGTECPGPL